MSTVVYAIAARSAVGLESASTAVYALRARSAAGLKYASTVVYALRARSATDRAFPWAVGFCDATTDVHAIS